MSGGHPPPFGIRKLLKKHEQNFLFVAFGQNFKRRAANFEARHSDSANRGPASRWLPTQIDRKMLQIGLNETNLLLKVSRL